MVLLVVLAGVLAAGPLLQARRGREFAQWYVYGSSWFMGLLALLGANLVAATASGFPWKKSQAGTVVLRIGLLVLLAGVIQTLAGGIEGEVALRTGAQTDHLLLTGHSVITVHRPTPRGRVATEFAFRPGPVNWRDGQALDFGLANGLGLRVVKFYRHARTRTDWVPDASGGDGPAVQLQLAGPSGNLAAEEWLTGNRFGGEAVLGPTQFELLPVTAETMLQDFLAPPTDSLGTAGVLSIHHAGGLQRVPVEGQLKKKIPVGSSGLAVEIADYLPNARPTPDGRFASRGEHPKNPLLELLVYEPGRDQPTRQVAFAKLPLLNLDGVHGRELPLKFWYHHAGVSPNPGGVFLQTPSGKLYCKAAVGGKYQPPREVRAGGRIPLGADFTVTLAQHLPQARQELTCLPLGPADSPVAEAEAAALVEITVGDERRQVWLQRQDDQYGVQSLSTARGPVVLTFGYEQLPLGFQLKLDEFTRPTNPDRAGNAGLVSAVRITDAAGANEQRRTIAMNQPLRHGQFTFTQSGFRKPPGAMEISVLTAAYDPGRALKYCGSLLICVGIGLMFCLRSDSRWMPRPAHAGTVGPLLEDSLPVG